MLTTENIKKLKKEWYSFEDIKKLIDRLDKIEEWKAKFIDEEEFWSNVYSWVNSNIKKVQCIK